MRQPAGAAASMHLAWRGARLCGRISLLIRPTRRDGIPHFSTARCGSPRAQSTCCRRTPGPRVASTPSGRSPVASRGACERFLRCTRSHSLSPFGSRWGVGRRVRRRGRRTGERVRPALASPRGRRRAGRRRSQRRAILGAVIGVQLCDRERADACVEQDGRQRRGRCEARCA
jgi:hypothetical protein